MRTFPTTTCITALAATLAPTPSMADTTVSSSTSSALQTASAGNVSVTSAGSVTVASGVAVAVDSSNTVANAGGITVGGANDAAAITVAPGVATAIDNSGTISVTESYVPVDEDANGIADGPIASATNRFGIHAISGGTVSGNIVNSGTITVEGLNSGGIVLDSALGGSLTNSGTIRAIGDYAAGIRTGNVSGNITIINGSVTAIGEGASALAVTGDVGGSVILQGTLQQAASYTNDNSTSVTLSRSDLRVGASAVSIAGNVAGGVIVAIPPTTSASNTDVDNDGVADASEGTGAIIGYGNGPALQIGGASATTIGPVTGNAGGYSVVIDGSVSGNAYYTSTDAVGLSIGGKGGAVNLPGGISVGGTLSAATVDSAATALLISEGATVGRLYNSGTISATISSPGEGAVFGVRDLSGTLTALDNTGFITVSGTSEDTRRAIDLSANTTGVTITQALDATDTATRATAEKDGAVDSTVYTAIRGDIYTGAGNDLLNVSDGQVTGNTYFGAGDDSLLLSGRSVYSGKVYFGTGAARAALSGKASFTGTLDFGSTAGALTIADTAVFKGAIVNGATASVTVNGGTFGAKAAETSTIGALTVNAGGTFQAYIDTATGTSSRINATTATFAEGAKVAAAISSIDGAAGAYTILSAGTLNGTATFDEAATNLPFIFAGSVATTGNDMVLTIRQKAADELGLRRAAGEAANAIIAASVNDTKMENDILGITDAATLQSHFDQLLPDHAGGVFDAVTRGSRLAAQHVMDGDSLHADYGVGAWFEPIYWRASKDATDTAAYRISGWGLSGGLEEDVGFGRVGLSYAWLKGKVQNNGGSGQVDTSQNEIGAFWRVARGGFYGFARGAAAQVSLKSARSFTGASAGTEFTYSNSSAWKGWLYSGAGGASYQFDLGDDVSLRPQGTLDYYLLKEKAHVESGGGAAMDLAIDKRDSSALSATTTLTAAYRFGSRRPDERPLTLEIEGGRRSVLSGTLGATSAHFANGETFSITPDGQKSSWIGEARLLAGGYDFTWKLAARAEQSNGNMAWSGRASLSASF